MIEIGTGSILEADVQAIVNPVNCRGVMGKGLALEVKRRWPDVFRVYAKACCRSELHPGDVQVVIIPTQPSIILNLATKDDWRDPSRIEWIERGIDRLVFYRTLHRIQSIAIPAIGCGLGGLDWAVVRPLLVGAFENLRTRCVIFDPQ